MLALAIYFISFVSYFQSDFSDIIEWQAETEYEFGDIALGEPVQHTFTFKNLSDEPIVIDNVRTSCGCTGSTWVQAPVMPDSTGTIVLEYDAALPGYFRKYARVFFNHQRKAEKLWVTGFVLAE
ncbi:MAG: DUF1573 domain-containing protein [Saprospiraceae bacterium]|nr:DUF1573 domain-containing protein [Saprospiraceae bacterium]